MVRTNNNMMIDDDAKDRGDRAEARERKQGEKLCGKIWVGQRQSLTNEIGGVFHW